MHTLAKQRMYACRTWDNVHVSTKPLHEVSTCLYSSGLYITPSRGCCLCKVFKTAGLSKVQGYVQTADPFFFNVACQSIRHKLLSARSLHPRSRRTACQPEAQRTIRPPAQQCALTRVARTQSGEPVQAAMRSRRFKAHCPENVHTAPGLPGAQRLHLPSVPSRLLGVRTAYQAMQRVQGRGLGS